MTVYPLPEQVSNEKKEKLLDDAVLPTAVVTINKAGYTPVSTLAAASARAQRRLRSFRRLMIVLMVIGLLIIAVALAYGLYKGVYYKMHHRNTLTSALIHHHLDKDKDHMPMHNGGHSHHLTYRVFLNGERLDSFPNTFNKPMVEEEADIDEKSGTANIFSPAIFKNNKLYRESVVLHIFSPRISVIQDNIKDKCFIKPAEFKNDQKVDIDTFSSFKGLLDNKFIPEMPVVRKSWFAGKPIPEVDVAQQYHPKVQKFCLGRTTYRLIPIGEFSLVNRNRNIGPPLFGSPAEVPQNEDEVSSTECSEPICTTKCLQSKLDGRGCKTCDCYTTEEQVDASEDKKSMINRKKREAEECETYSLNEGFIPFDDYPNVLLDIKTCK